MNNDTFNKYESVKRRGSDPEFFPVASRRMDLLQAAAGAVIQTEQFENSQRASESRPAGSVKYEFDAFTGPVNQVAAATIATAGASYGNTPYDKAASVQAAQQGVQDIFTDNTFNEADQEGFIAALTQPEDTQADFGLAAN